MGVPLSWVIGGVMRNRQQGAGAGGPALGRQGAWMGAGSTTFTADALSLSTHAGWEGDRPTWKPPSHFPRLIRHGFLSSCTACLIKNY